MVKTTEEIENTIPKISKNLMMDSAPKWQILRFLINMSLSIEEKNSFEFDVNLNGKEYRLEQVTGLNKEDDKTELYKKMINLFNERHNIEIKDFEKNLSYHIQRGYFFIEKSIEKKFNLYEYIYQKI